MNRKTALNRGLSALFLVLLIVIMVLTSGIIQSNRALNKVIPPKISGITLSKNGISVSYYTEYDPDDVKISLEGSAAFGNISISLPPFSGKYGSVFIPVSFSETLPNLFNGIAVSISGTLDMQSIEHKSITKMIQFNDTYIAKASLNFTSIYMAVDRDHWKTETTCTFIAPFLVYEGNISISYETYFEIIQSELDTVEYPNNGITAGLKQISSYNHTMNFTYPAVFPCDTVVFDLSKTYYYKEYPQDVIDFCGRYLDLRVAINLEQSNNTAPDPIYYFKNITFGINGMNISAPDSSAIVGIFYDF